MTSDDADRCGPPVWVFRSPYFKGVRFECRPLDRQPPDKTLAFMYRKNGEWLKQAGVGIFKDGAWTNGKGGIHASEGLYWTAMVDD